MARLRCSGCGFSMEFRVPPREAIVCPQCNEYLEDVTPRAATAVQTTYGVEDEEAAPAEPRRPRTPPTVVQKARAVTRTRPASAESEAAAPKAPQTQPTVLQKGRVPTRTHPARPVTELADEPGPEPEEEPTARAESDVPALAPLAEEPPAAADEFAADEQEVGLVPQTELQPTAEVASEEEEPPVDEAPADPSSAIVSAEELKKQKKPKLVKVQARRVATQMLKRKQPTLPPAPRDESEDEDEEDSKPIRLAPAADADEDDDDDGESAPRWNLKVKPKVIAAYVVVAGALAFAVPRLIDVAMPHLGGDKKPVAAAPLQPAVSTATPTPTPTPTLAPRPPANVVPPPPRTNPPDQPEVEVPTLPVATTVEYKADDAYKRLLQSTVWIVGKNEREVSWGTGALVHVEQRLVLTNYHVVQGHRQTEVHFPLLKDKEVITDPTQYKQGISANIVAHDTTRDLALLQLEKVPTGTRSLSLALQSVSPGAKLYSLGSSGVRDKVLWRFTEGTVRQVAQMEAKQAGSGLRFKGWVVETQSPVNSGDSGGPVMNAQLELAALVCMSDKGSSLVNACIDIRELRAFLENFGGTRGIKWDEGSSSPSIDASNVERVVLQLLPILEKGSPAARVKALGVLLQAGPAGRMAIPTLLPLLKGSDDEVRRLALLAIDRMGAPGPEALPHLREFLKDEHVLVRRYAARAAGRMGKQARPLVPQLVPLLSDTDRDVVIAALQCIQLLGNDARAAAPQLLALLKHDDVDIVLQAADTLAALGQLPLEHFGRAAEMLDSPHDVIRIAAAGALLTAKDDDKACSLLANVFRDTRDEQAQRLAMRFLYHVPADRLTRLGPALGKLIHTGLEHADPQIKNASFTLLERLAPEPQGSFEDVLACCKNMDPEMCTRAMSLLHRYGPQADKAVTLLCTALNEKDPKVQNCAMKALAELGPRARGACPSLILLLQDEKTHAPAQDALVAIGKESVSDLTYALRNRDPHIRLGAAAALGKIGPDARTATVPLSILSRSDPYPGVRQAAQAALTLVQAKK